MRRSLLLWAGFVCFKGCKPAELASGLSILLLRPTLPCHPAGSAGYRAARCLSALPTPPSLAVVSGSEVSYLDDQISRLNDTELSLPATQPPCSYNGGRSLDAFMKFIEEKVAADAGFARVDALVPLAQVRVLVAEKCIVCENFLQHPVPLGDCVGRRCNAAPCAGTACLLNMAGCC